MNGIYILLSILITVSIAGIAVFLLLTRPGKNLLKTILFNRKYVVCHLQNKNTGYSETWRVIHPG